MSAPKRRKVEHSSDHENGDVSTKARQNARPRRPRASKSLAEEQQGTITADMYGKNVLQMQTEDLLKELSSLRQRRTALARPLLHQLKSAVESLPDRPPSGPVAAEQKLWREAKVAVPYPEPRPGADVNYTVAYKQPLRVNVVGSFALDTAFVRKRHLPVLDMCLTMPTHLFQPKDYLNYRYFYKRAYYLACVAAGLSKAEGQSFSFHYDYLSGNSLQPVLVALPLKEKAQKFCIRILLAVSPEAFPVKKTLPFQNCVRTKNANGSTDEHSANAEQKPTPMYNTSLRADSNIEPYLKLLNSTTKISESFAQASVLLRVWLSQRGMGSAISMGGFGGFEASTLVALLLRGGGAKGQPVLSPGYNSLQLFKATLQFLTKRNLVKDIVLIEPSDDVDKRALSGKFPVFWDGQRGMNILYKMTPSSYSLLRHYAHVTVESLQSDAADSFDSTFMLKTTDPTRFYDDLLKIEIKKSSTKSTLTSEGFSLSAALSLEVYSVLHRALGDRAKAIVTSFTDNEVWSNLANAPSRSSPAVGVGFILDSQHYNRIVDRGPSAEDKDAAASYQKFWGSKSELRRFQDGSIVESVIWQRGSDEEPVHRQAIRYILQLKYPSNATNFQGWEPTASKELPKYASDALDRANAAIKNLEEFGEELKNFERMPLQIRSFRPAHLSLGNFPNYSARLDRVDAVLEFEGSASWPEDLVAIQRTKAALLSKIAELVQNKYGDSSCKVGLEETSSQLTNLAHLDIFTSAQSPLIRVRIQHEREAEILSTKLRLARSSVERQASSEALSRYERLFVREPAHFQAVRQLSIRMPVLLPSIMLFKKWCASHLLTAHLSDQLIDLLVIRAFTTPYPFATPANASAALLRVLDFLSRWDWRHEPLVVDINEGITAEQHSEAGVRFQAWRKVDPQHERLAVFAASNVDTDGATWTRHAPSKPVLSRMIALAKAASGQTAAAAAAAVAATTAPQHEQRIDIRSIFATGLADFDFVIHLKPRYLAHSHHHHHDRSGGGEMVAFKNLQLSRIESFEAAAAPSPARMFIEEISVKYVDVLLFFHDWAERPMVAGLWTPATSSPRSFKIGLDYSSQPVNNAEAEGEGEEEEEEEEATGDMVEANKDGILNDIVRLGGDLVASVDFTQ